MAEKLTSGDMAFRAELAEANIDPDSFLATDYLNHFNEIVMLLEMAVDMPDLMEEAESWKPKSYVDHFRDSGFVARELVIQAWNMVSPGVRGQFESVAFRLDDLILSILDVLKKADLSGGAFDDQTRAVVTDGQAAMQEHLAMLNTIIHNGSGSEDGDPESGEREVSASVSSDAQSQDEIDQLFD